MKIHVWCSYQSKAGRGSRVGGGGQGRGLRWREWVRVWIFYKKSATKFPPKQVNHSSQMGKILTHPRLQIVVKFHTPRAKVMDRHPGFAWEGEGRILNSNWSAYYINFQHHLPNIQLVQNSFSSMDEWFFVLKWRKTPNLLTLKLQNWQVT